MSNNILVIGANGNIGQPLVKLLLAQGELVLAASRSGQAVAGAQGIKFDFNDPKLIDQAFAQVDRAYIMVPAGFVDVKGLLSLTLAAAFRHKVKIVFQSVLGVDADDSIPYRQLELQIEASGNPYVILRPNWFMDNFHTFWLAGIQQGKIALPAAEGKSSFIAAADIAASAAAALSSSAFDGKAYNLTGPQALSYQEAASQLSDALGRHIEYTAIDDAAFIENLIAVGVPADYASFLASIFYPVREGWTAGVTNDVQTLTGAAPQSLAQYISAFKAAFSA